MPDKFLHCARLRAFRSCGWQCAKRAIGFLFNFYAAGPKQCPTRWSKCTRWLILSGISCQISFKSFVRCTRMRAFRSCGWQRATLAIGFLCNFYAVGPKQCPTRRSEKNREMAHCTAVTRCILYFFFSVRFKRLSIIECRYLG